MNKFALAVCLCLSLSAQSSFAQITIHVAPTADPHTSLTEFKKDPSVPVTIERALNILKSSELRDASGTPKEDITIQLEAGIYRLNEALKLDSTSSGSAEHPVTIQGPKVGSAIISGGREVKGFTTVKDPTVLARLPEKARTHLLQADLPKQGITDFGIQARHGFGSDGGHPTALEVTYRNQPLTLARWPNQGFTKIVTTPDGEKSFTFTVQGANLAAWKDEPHLLATGYWFQDWADTTIPIKSIDLASERITLTSPNPPFGIKAGQRVFIQNALAELDQPGEWYLDTTNGILYLWPPKEVTVVPAEAGIQPQEMNAVIPAKAGTQPKEQTLLQPTREQQNLDPSNRTEVEASLLEKLLVIDNASHIHLNNLTFQSARGDAITVKGGHNITIAHSTIRNIGNRAAVISGLENGLTDMLIEDIGEGGVVLAGGDRQTLTPSNLYVESSTIRRFARVSRTLQPAILLNGVGNRAVGNKIFETPHVAILFNGNEHLISLNEIFDVCKETGDAGAIYTGRDWSARGTVISYNYLHNIQSNKGLDTIRGIYLDDYASGTTVRGNLFDKVGEAIFIHGGRDNLIEDNTFLRVEFDLSVITPQHGWKNVPVAMKDYMVQMLKAVPYNQQPYKDRYSHLANILEDEPGLPKYNIARRNLVIGNTQTRISKDAEAGNSISQFKIPLMQ